MKKLIIHIGVPKTGSTTIQRSIANNSRLLRKNNISVVDFWSKSHRQTYLRSYLLNEVKGEMISAQPYCNTQRLEKCIHGWGGIVSTKFSKACEAFEELIHTCKKEYILISWEAFWDINLFEYFLKIIESCDGVKLHKIICFVRRQDTFAESMLQQIIKEGRIGDIDTYWETILSGTESLDWNKKLVELKEMARNAEFSVSIFEVTLEHPGLLRSFYESLGIINLDGLIKLEKKNTRLSWSALVIAYYYQNKVELSEFNRLMSLFAKSGFGGEGNYCFLEPSQRKQLLDMYQESNYEFFLLFNIGSKEVFEKWMQIEENTIAKEPIDFNHPEVLKTALIELAGLLDMQKKYFVYNTKFISKMKSIIKILIY